MKRSSVGKILAMGAASLGAIAASMTGNVAASAKLRETTDKLNAMFNRSRRSNGVSRNRSRHMPHVGARQIARNTRQLAAGQISFIEHGPRYSGRPLGNPVDERQTAYETPVKKTRARKPKVAAA